MSGFEYEDEVLKFIHTQEGRAVAVYGANGGALSFKYEYHYLDHQGNTRMTFSEGADQNPQAHFESVSADLGEGFQNSSTGNVVQAKEGLAHGVIAAQSAGAFKNITVSKGDVLSSSIWMTYLQNSTSNQSTSISPILTNSGSTGGSGDTQALNQWNLGISVTPGNNDNNNTSAQIALKMVLYDYDGNYIDDEYVILDGSKTEWLQTPELSWQIPSDGFVQVSVSNLSEAEVYVDQFEVNLDATLVAQENHYYPFGMELKGIGKAGNFPYLYNAQTELEKHFGIDWYETDFRRYDAQLGRFHGIDALAHAYTGITSYQYAFNNPVMFNDPSGLFGEEISALANTTSATITSTVNAQTISGSIELVPTSGQAAPKPAPKVIVATTAWSVWDFGLQYNSDYNSADTGNGGGVRPVSYMPTSNPAQPGSNTNPKPDPILIGVDAEVFKVYADPKQCPYCYTYVAPYQYFKNTEIGKEFLCRFESGDMKSHLLRFTKKSTARGDSMIFLVLKSGEEKQIGNVTMQDIKDLDKEQLKFVFQIQVASDIVNTENSYYPPQPEDAETFGHEAFVHTNYKVELIRKLILNVNNMSDEQIVNKLVEIQRMSNTINPNAGVNINDGGLDDHIDMMNGKMVEYNIFIQQLGKLLNENQRAKVHDGLYGKGAYYETIKNKMNRIQWKRNGAKKF